jgi:hypothetical protein
MAKGGSPPTPERAKTTVDLREQALFARRVALGVLDPTMRDRLIAYAVEIEAELAAKEEPSAPANQKAAPLRMRTTPILWGSAAPAMALAAPIPVPLFNPATARLLQQARLAAERTATLQRWRMPVRLPFETRTVARAD